MSLGFDVEINEEESLHKEKINEFEKTGIVPMDFTNAIAYGQTGSGKTRGFILPNVENRIKAGFGVVVFDFKETMYKSILQMADEAGRLDEVCELGVAWGKYVNLMKGMSAKEFERWHRGVFSNAYNKDPYWTNASRNLICAVINALSVLQAAARESLGQFWGKRRHIDSFDEFSFQRLNWCLKPSHMRLLLNDILETKEALDEALLECGGLKKEILQNLLRKCELSISDLSVFANLKDYGESDGDSGVIEVARNDLADLSSNVFIAQSKSDIKDLLGKIVIIHSESFSDNALKLLHERFFASVKERNFLSKNPIKTTFFIDEAHKVLSSVSEPDVSVCREFKIEYILAVQNENLLIKCFDSYENFKSISQNISYQVSFRNPDFNEMGSLKDFEFISLFNSKFFNNHKIAKITKPYFKNDDENKANAKYLNLICAKNVVFRDTAGEFLNVKFQNANEISNDEFLSLIPHFSEKVEKAFLIDKNQNKKEVRVHIRN